MLKAIFPWSKDRGSIEAAALIRAALRSSSDFHGRKIVAPLKRNELQNLWINGDTFPWSKDRGSIEAWMGSTLTGALLKFPWSKDRGSIEA